MAARSAAPERCRECGFTLLESLLALMVIAVGVLGIATLLVQALAQQRQAAAESAANNLLAEGAELLQLPDSMSAATLAAAVAQWQARVASELTPAGAAATLTPTVLPDGSNALQVQINTGSLALLSVATNWPMPGP